MCLSHGISHYVRSLWTAMLISCRFYATENTTKICKVWSYMNGDARTSYKISNKIIFEIYQFHLSFSYSTIGISFPKRFEEDRLNNQLFEIFVGWDAHSWDGVFQKRIKVSLWNSIMQIKNCTDWYCTAACHRNPQYVPGCRGIGHRTAPGRPEIMGGSYAQTFPRDAINRGINRKNKLFTPPVYTVNMYVDEL